VLDRVNFLGLTARDDLGSSWTLRDFKAPPKTASQASEVAPQERSYLAAAGEVMTTGNVKE